MWIKKSLPEVGETFFVDGERVIEFTHPQVKGRNFWSVTIQGTEYNNEYPVSLKSFDLRKVLENKLKEIGGTQ